MKYRPGHYSVITFCPLGMKLGTYWTDENRERFTTLSGAGEFADKLMEKDTVGSYAITRVIMNSEAAGGQW